MLVGGGAALACEAPECRARGGRQSDPDMIVCDGCQRAWHMQCLPRALDEVPAGAWHCPGCIAAGGPRDDAWQPGIVVGFQPLAWVERFRYLGSTFDSAGSLDPELSHRIQLAAYAFRRLEQPFFRQRHIPIRTRVWVYTALVSTVLLYGSESWALSAAQLQQLEVFHRHRLRLILGVRLTDRTPNDQLYARCGARPIAAMLARRQLRWVGHLGRMADVRVAKQALYCTMRSTGRSRRTGPRPRGLREIYAEHVARHLSQRTLRTAGWPRGTTWWRVCQHRPQFEGLLP